MPRKTLAQSSATTGLSPEALAFIKTGSVPEPAAAPASSAAPAAPAKPPVPAKGATTRFTLDLDPERHQRLRMAAASRGVRMAEIAREAIDLWLKQNAAQ